MKKEVIAFTEVKSFSHELEIPAENVEEISRFSTMNEAIDYCKENDIEVKWNWDYDGTLIPQRIKKGNKMKKYNFKKAVKRINKLSKDYFAIREDTYKHRHEWRSVRYATFCKASSDCQKDEYVWCYSGRGHHTYSVAERDFTEKWLIFKNPKYREMSEDLWEGVAVDEDKKYSFKKAVKKLIKLPRNKYVAIREDKDILKDDDYIFFLGQDTLNNPLKTFSGAFQISPMDLEKKWCIVKQAY